MGAGRALVPREKKSIGREVTVASFSSSLLFIKGKAENLMH